MRNGFVSPWVSLFLGLDIWELEGSGIAVKLGEKKLVNEELNQSFLSEISDGEGKSRPQLSYLYFKFSLVCVHPRKLTERLYRAGIQKGSISLVRKEQGVIIRNNFIPLSLNKIKELKAYWWRLFCPPCVSL